MITKEKNRTKIICTVITAVLAAVTGGSVLRLYNVQNVTQTVNGNVIQILGETGSNISANMDLTDSTEELISEYKKVIDENSQYQTNQTTLQGQVQSLQSENDDLKSQIQILKGTLLNTYSSDEINSVIEQGGLKETFPSALTIWNALTVLIVSKSPPSRIYMEPRTVYRIALRLLTQHGLSSSWMVNMILSRQILLHRKIQIEMQT